LPEKGFSFYRNQILCLASVLDSTLHSPGGGLDLSRSC
jgi:hypothetical protein